MSDSLQSYGLSENVKGSLRVLKNAPLPPTQEVSRLQVFAGTRKQTLLITLKGKEKSTSDVGRGRKTKNQVSFFFFLRTKYLNQAPGDKASLSLGDRENVLREERSQPRDVTAAMTGDSALANPLLSTFWKS